MTGQAPSTGVPGQSSGLRLISRPPQFTFREIVSFVAVGAIFVAMVYLDFRYFPSYPVYVSAVLLGAEAEAWVAGVLGIEVWFTFLRYRSGPPDSGQLTIANLVDALKQAFPPHESASPSPTGPVGPEGNLARQGSDTGQAGQSPPRRAEEPPL